MTATAYGASHELGVAFCLIAGTHQDIAEMLSIVQPEDFAERKARALVTCAKRVFESGRTIDAGTMLDAAQATETLADIGGRDALIEVMLTQATSTQNAKWYAEQVRAAASRRRALLATSDLSAALRDEKIAPEEAVSATITALSKILEGDTSRVEPIATLLTRVVTEMGSPAAGGYVSTGLRTFDDVFGGIPSGLVVVGARPGVGKSSLCAQVAGSVAKSAPVLYFSLEMTAREVALVLVAQESGVSTQRIAEGSRYILKDDESAAILMACGRIENAQLHIATPIRSTLGMIRALSIQQKLRTGLGLVVVDFLQRIKPDSSRRTESRERDVAEIAQGLSELAKELSCPVLCPAAINRAMVAGNRKPNASDLRESGNIESEAHMVIMLHRPEVTDAAQDSEEMSTPEIIVVKHRGGPLGMIPCRFTGASQRWEPIDSGARF